jgi:putative protease
MIGTRVGEVTHYFDRLGVATVLLCNPLAKGDAVHFLGHGSDFIQQITSMQIEHDSILAAKQGDEVAIKTDKPVKALTAVFLITEE